MSLSIGPGMADKTRNESDSPSKIQGPQKSPKETLDLSQTMNEHNFKKHTSNMFN